MEIKIKSRTTASLYSAGTILIGTAISAHAAVVINEIDYDQPGSDTAEFIELYNSDTNPVSLDGYTLELINGTNGDAYNSYDLSSHTISANGYFVLCSGAAAIANCNIDIASGSWIQNGGNDGDAVALLSEGAIIDSISYEGISSYLVDYAEGDSFAPADSTSINMSIARLPNGFDSNDNASDFDSACLTPGAANIGGTGDCSIRINPVPVPAAAWLFGSGLAGLTVISRRKNSKLPE